MIDRRPIVSVEPGSLQSEKSISELEAEGYLVVLAYGDSLKVHEDISLRDRFAMAALQGLASSISDSRKDDLRDGIQGGMNEARVAYVLASAMMKARDI